MGGNFDLSFIGEEIEAQSSDGLARETTPTTYGFPHTGRPPPSAAPWGLPQEGGPEDGHPNLQPQGTQ